MASWRVEFSKQAENDFGRLDKPIRKRVVEALEWLAKNFDDIVPIPLGGPWRGFFKFRVGDWRVIYAIKPTTHALVVYYIDRRDRVYKRG